MNNELNNHMYSLIINEWINKHTVSFHNFKSRNFKFSVSNPESKYVAYVSVLSRISNCQGLGRRNRFEILKTDRIHMYMYVYIYIYIYIYIGIQYCCLCIHIYTYMCICICFLCFCSFSFSDPPTPFWALHCLHKYECARATQP